MNQSSVERSLNWLIENYFSSKDRSLTIKKAIVYSIKVIITTIYTL